ncbi:hypothetical protein [Moorena producens]|uniref:hypothetical protein n=1 Tax=Moorena producens TaxID=1155739 RepID=UPI003C74E9FA
MVNKSVVSVVSVCILTIACISNDKILKSVDNLQPLLQILAYGSTTVNQSIQALERLKKSKKPKK